MDFGRMEGLLSGTFLYPCIFHFQPWDLVRHFPGPAFSVAPATGSLATIPQRVVWRLLCNGWRFEEGDEKGRAGGPAEWRWVVFLFQNIVVPLSVWTRTFVSMRPLSIQRFYADQRRRGRRESFAGAFRVKAQRRILQIKWKDFITNDAVE